MRVESSRVIRCTVLLLPAVLISTLTGVRCWNKEDYGSRHAAFDSPSADLNIFAADGEQIIGRAQYSISREDGTESLRLESHYFDGEYDIELETLRTGRYVPKLVSYERYFVNSDRSPQRMIALNMKTGAATCKIYSGGRLREDFSAMLTLPADTYAGAAQILFIVECLRQKEHEIQFHSFNCAPRPAIIAARAVPDDSRSRWSMYSGDLIKVEIVPDFGWRWHR